MTSGFLRGLTHKIAAPGIVAAAWAVLAMMVIATADVVGTMFNHPIAGAHELVETLMVVVIFLALPYAESRDQHIAVDLIYNRLPAGWRRVFRFAGLVLGLGFFSAMSWQGWKLFWNSWVIREYASGAVQFPVYPSKALFALGVTAASIVILIKLVAAIRTSPAPAADTDFQKQEIA